MNQKNQNKKNPTTFLQNVKFRPYDKLLPNQKYLKLFYKKNKSASIEKRLYYFCKNFSSWTKKPKQKFRGVKNLNTAVFSSDLPVLNLLGFIITVCQPEKILEIGTFCGIGTDFLAKHSHKRTKIISLEKFKSSFNAAKKNLKHFCKTKKITLINGDALTILKKLLKTTKFDLIFVDGDKDNYDKYFKILNRNLNRKSILLFDDIFMNGDSLNAKTKNKKTIGVKKLLKEIKNSKDFENFMMPIGNGVLICIKK